MTPIEKLDEIIIKRTKELESSESKSKLMILGNLRCFRKYGRIALFWKNEMRTINILTNCGFDGTVLHDYFRFSIDKLRVNNNGSE